jgi:DNA invertase Pin-like site-specific DNA recombinase
MGSGFLICLWNIGAVAEFERGLTSERVKAGLENAKMKGKRLGRPRIPGHLHEKIEELLKKSLSNRAIARDLNISEGSVRNFRKARAL